MNKASNNIFIRFFNMVEVTLAIAVVGIGVAGIMSLFPVAVSASRDSIADNYSADVADQIIAYVSALAGKSSGWAAFKTAIPDAVPSDSDVAPDSVSISGTPVLGNLYSGVSGVFRVVMKSDTIIDFSAYVKVWRTELPPVYVAGETAPTGWDSTFNYGSGIHIEISYPAEVAYVQRKKLNYYFEVFNPAPTP